jgi:DNA replication and repair protein RecF
MWIQKLNSKNFRNYLDVSLDFTSQVNFLYGSNGAGKTNILEMIQLVVLGESFKIFDLKNITPKNTTLSTIIKADMIFKGSSEQLQFQLIEGKKHLFRNEKKDSQKSRYENFSTVVFSPESLTVIKDEPALRRKLLDQALMGFFPDGAEIIQQYSRALKSRNEILKKIAESPHPAGESQLSLLESLTEVFIRNALEMTFARLQFLQKLSQNYSEVAKKVLQLQDVDISVDYLISSESAIDWSMEQVYDSLLQRSKELKAAEMASGRSLIGPHKHDVRFNFDGKDARVFCSQGQQRTLILAFKIAQIEAYKKLHGHFPILLLDDVMSELDEERRESLVNILRKTPAQIFITTTEREHGPKITEREVTMFKVQNGKVEREG